MRRLTLILILLAVVFTTFSSDEAEARRKRRTRSKKQKIINEKKLYERIGGAKQLTFIVDEWVRLNLADQRIAPSFAQLTAKPERLARFRRGLNDQLCELADGPCTYKGADMKKSHESMKVSEEQFLVFSENLFRSMEKFNVTEREKNEMLARVGEMRSDVVADTPATNVDSKGDAGAEKSVESPVERAAD